MTVKYISETDKEFIMNLNNHIRKINFGSYVYAKMGYVMWEQNIPVGYMLYCTLWDSIPSMLLTNIEDSDLRLKR